MRSLLVFIVLATCFGCQKPEQVKAETPPVQIRGKELQRIQQLEGEVASLRARSQKSHSSQPQQASVTDDPNGIIAPVTPRKHAEDFDTADRKELDAEVVAYNALLDQYLRLNEVTLARLQRFEAGKLPQGSYEFDPMKARNEKPPEDGARRAEAASIDRDIQKLSVMARDLSASRQWIKNHRFGRVYRYEDHKNGTDFARIVLR